MNKIILNELYIIDIIAWTKDYWDIMVILKQG
jgi:hypothetical protein